MHLPSSVYVIYCYEKENNKQNHTRSFDENENQKIRVNKTMHYDLPQL